jgi:hypothetical protein
MAAKLWWNGSTSHCCLIICIGILHGQMPMDVSVAINTRILSFCGAKLKRFQDFGQNIFLMSNLQEDLQSLLAMKRLRNDVQ